MTAETPAGGSRPRQIHTSAERFRWLAGELRAWQREGLIDAATANAISDRYVVPKERAVTNLPVRVILILGSFFVGVGLIWLVASNLDELSPLVRFVVVTLIWIALAVTGELTQRLVSAAFKLLTALAFGAVVFQAAQSLQVPAYRPQLLLAWGSARCSMPMRVAAGAPPSSRSRCWRPGTSGRSWMPAPACRRSRSPSCSAPSSLSPSPPCIRSPGVGSAGSGSRSQRSCHSSGCSQRRCPTAMRTG